MKSRAVKMLIVAAIVFLLIVVFSVGFLFSRLLSGYEIHGDTVLYRSFNNMTWKIDRTEVAGASADQMHTIRGSGGLYGSDGRRVFFEGSEITQADAATFEVLDWRNELSRDANLVFWKTGQLSDDPDHFVILSRGYSKDRQHVYYALMTVEDADPDSFVVTGTATSTAHDKNHRFDMGRKVKTDQQNESDE